MNNQKLKTWEPLSKEEIDKYWHLVEKIAVRFTLKHNKNNSSYIAPYVSVEDIQNELYPALLETLRTYDPDHPKKAKIETCINSRCSQRLIDFIRSKYWIKRTAYKKVLNEGNLNYINSNSETLDLVQVNNEVIESFETEEFANYLFKDIHTVRDSSRTYNILYQYYIKGIDVETLANFYDISKDNVHIIIKKSKPEIKRRATRYGKKIDLFDFLDKSDDDIDS